MVVCTIFLSCDCWTLYNHRSRESKQYGWSWIIQQHLTWNSYLRAISPFLRWCRMSTIVWLPVNPPEWVEQGLKSEYPRRRVAVFSPQAGDPQSIMSWYFQHQSATSVVTQTRTSTLVGDSTKRVLIWLRLGHRLQLLCYSQPKTVVEIKSSSGGAIIEKNGHKKGFNFYTPWP